jgi:hypothetical protein
MPVHPEQGAGAGGRLPGITAGLALLTSAGGIAAEQPRFVLEGELGSVWQSSNDVKIPNDQRSDRFDLTDIAGSGPWASLRLNGAWNINERHGLRIVIAPLAYEEQGSFDRSVRFQGETFRPDTALEAEYRFNSWRVGYRYRYFTDERWQLWVGATANIRDAEITLRQGDTRATDDDVGFVPLLHLAGEYRFDSRWRFEFDFDGLAGGPGRALDLSLKLGYELNDRWRISAGYRGLEGGVDTDDVYNFAWFNTALVSTQYRF